MRPRVVAVVEARTGSRRLPGKVLADLAGRPLVARVIERAGLAEEVDEVVLATSDRPDDAPLAEIAEELGVSCHRGSESDVLRRVREAAESVGAGIVVRVTGDCPLLDPRVVDQVVAGLLEDAGDCDYASNILRRTFPRGLDAEAMYADVLARMDRLGSSPEAREYVTWFCYRERPDLFLLRSIETDGDWSHLDWSVDEAKDLELVRLLYERHGLDRELVSWRRLLPPETGAQDGV